MKHYKLKDNCRYCGAKDNLTIDHKQPKILGGLDAPNNLQTLCKDCNMLKSGIPHKRFVKIMEHGVYCFIKKHQPLRKDND